MTTPLLEARDLRKAFEIPGSRARVHAVNGVDLTIRRGETVGIVGESGSGKSTLGRLLLRLVTATGGSIRFRGDEITNLSERRCRPLRPSMQMVFQDPWNALNPKLTIGQLMEEPLKLHTSLSSTERKNKVADIVARVRLPADVVRRYPSELSGGQLQRVCIARAIATEPQLIVLDEPTSALDLSVRAGILELLRELRDRTQVALIFISHDLGTVKLISDRIVVLYLGFVVEEGTADDIFRYPRHPYTQSLISAHLSTDPRIRASRIPLRGEIPSPIKLPAGCAFASRCPAVIDKCRAVRPLLQDIDGPMHRAACLRLPDTESVNCR